ncbi:hypothetical protein E3N88_43634 [Mikania micrantha]|uniref:Spen paralogue and orthologue SPOC C-terminal domain-containing protein n=1 Tax=Mikania micrantha TaxID=192012 RepID=A0A5N6LGK8_9ASTR|nr:hypothetical protein E3N88_43634 [Mikania micrantha]
MEPVWNNTGSPKPLLPTKRKAATEPMSPSVVDKRVGQMDHVNKRPTSLQTVANKSGSQRVQTPKNKTAIHEASPKAQSGSSEAVRSKMRETLAAALSVGIQNQEKPPNEHSNAPSEAVKTHVDFILMNLLLLLMVSLETHSLSKMNFCREMGFLGLGYGKELASKQLSEWRMAKAEEHDKMIVLQESDVDIRRLVKKTHKGEYQVEVEQEDAVSVRFLWDTDVDKSSSENLTIPTDGNDFMQELIVDEFKDEGFLPPIVSLDEFMESLNSEPPFENLSVDSETNSLNSETVVETDGEKKVTSEPASAGRIDQPKSKSNDAVLSMKTSDTSVAKKAVSASSAFIGEYVWEGELQLTISSSILAIGLFRSGEKTSTKDWPVIMEIKGRVRLDAFEKFFKNFLCLELAVDYIGDERLGFGEPIPGVELYFSTSYKNHRNALQTPR